jgi:hypothetical protein
MNTLLIGAIILGIFSCYLFTLYTVIQVVEILSGVAQINRRFIMSDKQKTEQVSAQFATTKLGLKPTQTVDYSRYSDYVQEMQK